MCPCNNTVFKIIYTSYLSLYHTLGKKWSLFWVFIVQAWPISSRSERMSPWNVFTYHLGPPRLPGAIATWRTPMKMCLCLRRTRTGGGEGAKSLRVFVALTPMVHQTPLCLVLPYLGFDFLILALCCFIFGEFLTPLSLPFFFLSFCPLPPIPVLSQLPFNYRLSCSSAWWWICCVDKFDLELLIFLPSAGNRCSMPAPVMS